MDSDVATSAAINSPSMPAPAKQHDLRSADHRSHSNLFGFGSGTHENDKGNVLLPTSDNLNFEKAATATIATKDTRQAEKQRKLPKDPTKKVRASLPSACCHHGLHFWLFDFVLARPHTVVLVCCSTVTVQWQPE
jgi:hypothetical protein